LHIPCPAETMATKRKAVLPLRLYERGLRGDEWLEGRLTPLNEAIPERGFEDAEFIPNLPNRLVVELIWQKIIKGKDKNSQEPIKEALKMRFMSKFWLKFVDHSDVMLNQHCKFILKRTVAERAAAPSRFRHWRHRILL
jgi:hypothetical protein